MGHEDIGSELMAQGTSGAVGGDVSVEKDPESPTHGLPTISLIINTCDRAQSLRRLLHALQHQSYDRFEVIPVVGPTRDNTVDVLEQEFADRVCLVRCPVFNLSVSRNYGLVHAAGEVVAFVDDDAVPSSTWLAQLAQEYRKKNVAGVGGKTYNIGPGCRDEGKLQFLNGLISVLGEQADIRADRWAPPPSSTPSKFWFPRLHGTNMSYRRQALMDIGGFDERFEYLFDDADIGVRLGLEGSRISHLNEAVVYHVPGTGRNRGEDWDVNWYCWLRSTIYFALKNGRKTVGLRPALQAAIRHVLAFFDLTKRILKTAEINPTQYRAARKAIRRACWDGFYQGLLAKPLYAALAPKTARPLRQYKNSESSRTPFISPVDHCGGVQLKATGDTPLRVCLLSVGYPPRSTEGIARHTYFVAKGLSELGHEVHVITLGESEKVFVREGTFVHEVCLRGRRRYQHLSDSGFQNLVHWLDYSHAVWEKVQSLRVNHDIQIIDSPLWNLEGLACAVAGELPVVIRIATAMKQISGIHEQLSPENEMIAELESRFLQMADGFIPNSKASVHALAEIYGLAVSEKSLSIVPHGILPAPEDKAAIDQKPKPRRTEVLYVGRLEGRKGIIDLFEAIPHVLQECPETQFVIVGSDNSLQDGFQARTKTDYPSYFRRKYSTCIDSVRFLGFVDDAELEELYRNCDLFVAPSLYESFGLIYLEAMNFGKPTIGCNVGGAKEIIVDGETGYLVPASDGKMLAQAVIRLVKDSQLRAKMGTAARERLLAHYTHTKMAERFVEAYRRVIEGG